VTARIVPDGHGGLKAEYVPVVGTFPGSTTGIKTDAAGNVIAQGAQVAELIKLNGGQLPAPVAEMPAPANVPDAALSPAQAGQFALSLAYQRDAVARAVSTSQPDAGLNTALDTMRGMQTVDASLTDDHDTRPRTAQEFRQREDAAAQLAAQLGYVMAVVPKYCEQIVPLTGGPAYERRIYALIAGGAAFNCVQYLDELHNIERRLAADLTERARRASREAVAAEHPAQVPVVRVLSEDEAHAQSPAGRIAKLESDLARALALLDAKV
jgi:hypothetical protein